MCRYCNVEKGNSIILTDETVEITVGKRTLEDHILSVMINHDLRDKWFLSSHYFMDGDEPVASIKKEIRYCPFCGRELNEH